jgi:hypothetical protein
MVAAVDDPEGRRLRGRRARGEVVGRYAWKEIGGDRAAVALTLSNAGSLSTPGGRLG